jgi:hypothetical protein
MSKEESERKKIPTRGCGCEKDKSASLTPGLHIMRKKTTYFTPFSSFISTQVNTRQKDA